VDPEEKVFAAGCSQNCSVSATACCSCCGGCRFLPSEVIGKADGQGGAGCCAWDCCKPESLLPDAQASPGGDIGPPAVAETGDETEEAFD